MWHESVAELKKVTANLETTLAEYQAVTEASVAALELLGEVDRELAKPNFELSYVMELIVRGALRLVKAEYADFLIPDDSKQLRVEWSSRGPELNGKFVPIDNSVTGQAFRSGESVCHGDVRLPDIAYYSLADGMVSELAVPLKVEDEVLGVINVESRLPNAFSDHHRAVVQTLAGQTALAFRKARLQTEMAAIIQNQAQLLAEPDAVNSFLALIGDRARRLVGAEACQVLRKDGDELVIEYTTGSEMRGTRVLVADSVTGLAVDSRRVLNIEDIGSDELIAGLYRAVFTGMRSELAVPLIVGDEVLGVINFESPLVGAFKGRESLLKLFADQAAVALLIAKRVKEQIVAEHSHSDLWTLAQIGDIAGNLVHRLNSHVGAIKLAVAEIRHREAGALQANHFIADRLTDIYSQAITALEYPRELQLRIERAKANTFDSLDVNQLVLDVLSRMDVPRSIQISFDLDDSLPTIVTALQFDEVIRNIAQNACEAMPAGGVLRVKTRPWRIEDSRGRPVVGVEINVTDTGIGMTRDRLHTLAMGQSRKKQGHLGYGLWWVRGFLDRIGGEAFFSSAEKQGFTFIVRVPLQSKRLDDHRH